MKNENKTLALLSHFIFAMKLFSFRLFFAFFWLFAGFPKELVARGEPQTDSMLKEWMLIEDSLKAEMGEDYEEATKEEDDTKYQIVENPSYEAIELRKLDSSKLSAYLEKGDFAYAKDKKKKEPNLWLQNLKKSIREFFQKSFGAGMFNGGKIMTALMYSLAIFAFILIFWGLMKLRAKEVFWSYPKPLENTDFSEIETKIDDIDFQKLIQTAFENGDYRMCVRWMYLETLKLLHQKQLIAWQPSKTNYDYADELRQTPFRNDFLANTRTFEYVFYGNYPLDAEKYMQAVHQFQAFQAEVGK